MRKIIVIVLFTLVTACKNKNAVQSDFIRSLPEAEDISNTLHIIFTNGFNFSEDLRIDKIGVEQIGKNRYKIFYFFSDSADLEEIQHLNIAFRVYPRYPMKFKNESDQKNKAKTIATKSKLSRIGDELVICTDEFSMAPKIFEESKVYLYHPDEGIIGKTMTILDLNFDF